MAQGRDLCLASQLHLLRIFEATAGDGENSLRWLQCWQQYLVSTQPCHWGQCGIQSLTPAVSVTKATALSTQRL